MTSTRVKYSSCEIFFHFGTNPIILPIRYIVNSAHSERTRFDREDILGLFLYGGVPEIYL